MTAIVKADRETRKRSISWHLPPFPVPSEARKPLKLTVPSKGIVVAVLSLALLVPAGNTTAAGPEPFSHEEWTALLGRYVDEEGLVDYEGLAGDRETFDRHVQAVESTSPGSHPELFPTPRHELAYYINAYNVLVFDGVLARGPEEDSVWKGGLVSGYGFFVGTKITIGGEKTNLRELENEVVRKRYQDPRIHAALNCASMSCPRLPQTAFAADRLDEQLDAAMREFVANERHVRIEESTRTVYLSKIFDWYKSDFTAYEKSQRNPKGTVIDYINRYRDPDAQVPRDFKTKILDYDKRINKQGQPWMVPS